MQNEHVPNPQPIWDIDVSDWEKEEDSEEGNNLLLLGDAKHFPENKEYEEFILHIEV
jgi:hypothetical protein